MISPFLKIVLRPILRSIDALLEKLHGQIVQGEKDEALRTVNELRAALKAAGDYLK